MARRRSARLASASKKPETSVASPTLASLAEREESPSEHALQSLDALVSSPAPAPLPARVPRTPADSTPIKPPMSEMHPSKAHQTMAAPSSGLRLGFTDIKPTADRNGLLSLADQSTPTKVSAPPSSPFTFSFARETPSDLKLGPDAQRMMYELRGEAAKIKADLAAKHEAEKLEEEQVNGRKFATARGKANRFSAAHLAEFKKMDSIENHPSAFRAQPGRTTPLATSSLKRSPSKANLDDTTDTVRSKQITPSPAVMTRGRKRASEDTPSPVKRAKQCKDDDASSSRPISRDGSFLPMPKSVGKSGGGIPRSKSSLAALMTPTKSSLARTTSTKTPVPGGSLASPKPVVGGGLTRSATTNRLELLGKEQKQNGGGEELGLGSSVTMRSPTSSRLDQVKSRLWGQKSSPTKAAAAKASKSAIPLPSTVAAPKTANFMAALDKEGAMLPPATTPSRKLSKRVAFTPETNTRAALAQHTPSPIKSCIPRSKSSRQILGEVHYPTLESVMSGSDNGDNGNGGGDKTDGGVSYPDLSERRPLPEPPTTTTTTRNDEFEAGSSEAAVAAALAAAPSPPSTFTFRSDHTIRFDRASPSGFGSSPGQVSLRQVRPSILPTVNMPGSFPTSASIPGSGSVSASGGSGSSSDKENKVPEPVFPVVPHGMLSKKRHRVSTDEEDAEQEAARRAAKKRKQEVVLEGDALMAPRLLNGASASASAKKKATTSSNSPYKLDTPRAGTGIPSPIKKKPILSLSRLHMLARPKLRK